MISVLIKTFTFDCIQKVIYIFLIFRELRKRINSLNDLELQWAVYESIDQLQGKEMNPEHLYPDYVSISV